MPAFPLSAANRLAGQVGTRAALLAGGVALGLSFPPFPFPFLAFAALVPLLHRWRQAFSWRQALIDAYLTLLVTFAVAFSWPLWHVFPRVALASLNGILLLPLFLSLPFALSIPIRNRLGQNAGMGALVALYLVVELALSRGPWAFPWPLLGHTLAEALLINQFAEVTGVAGLTLLILIMNLLLSGLLVPLPRHQLRARVALVAVILLLAMTFGAVRVRNLPPADTALQVGMVQPGAGPEVWADLGDHRRVDDLLALSDSLQSAGTVPVDLLIWPETALPPGAALPHTGTPLLTGAILPAHGASYHNAALLLTPGQPVQQYAKRYLVPFAERIPFAETWPGLGVLSVPSGGVSGYSAGSDQPVLHVKGVGLGVLICLESAFGDHTRRFVKDGAGFLVTLTQDGWWGDTAGYRQHLAFTRLRAIETRRAVVQVSVSGISALIRPDGSLAVRTEWMERTARLVAAPVHKGTTFYVRYGDWLSYLACFAATLLLSASAILQVRQRLLEKRTAPVPASA